MIFYDGGTDPCQNPECCHAEINSVRACPGCMTFNMLIRDPRQLSDGDVYAYCPMCGTTYFVNVAQAPA